MKIPTREQVVEVIKERGYNIDPDHFYEYCIGCEWTVRDYKGKKDARKPMVSWRGTLWTWQKLNNKSTSFANVNKREQEVIKVKKELQLAPRKKAKANPEIKKLSYKYYKLGRDMHTVGPAQLRDVRKQRAQILKDMQKLRDMDTGLGNYL